MILHLFIEIMMNLLMKRNVHTLLMFFSILLTL